jgi:hypothetical protein
MIQRTLRNRLHSVSVDEFVQYSGSIYSARDVFISSRPTELSMLCGVSIIQRDSSRRPVWKRRSLNDGLRVSDFLSADLDPRYEPKASVERVHDSY